MSERSPLLYLDDLLDAGRAIQSYVRDVTFDEFNSDRMRQSAPYPLQGDSMPVQRDHSKPQTP